MRFSECFFIIFCFLFVGLSLAQKDLQKHLREDWLTTNNQVVFDFAIKRLSIKEIKKIEDKKLRKKAICRKAFLDKEKK